MRDLFEYSLKYRVPLCKAWCPFWSKEKLVDAVAFRMNTAVDLQIDDYYKSIEACIKRLENAN